MAAVFTRLSVLEARRDANRHRRMVVPTKPQCMASAAAEAPTVSGDASALRTVVTTPGAWPCSHA